MSLARRIRRLMPFLLFAGVGGVGADAGGDQLGRLFFTADERTEIDRLRQAGRSDAAQAATDDGRLTVNGRVRRSDGRHVVWVNGVPAPTSAGSLPVGSGDLRTGETLDIASGRKHDLIEGRVAVAKHGRNDAK